MAHNQERPNIAELPTLPIHHLPRKNYVKWLNDRLSTERKVIIVKGPDGSGKTTFLKEFVQSYPDQCFSFFIGADYWSSSETFFLFEMCDQMRRVLGEHPASNRNNSNVQVNQEFISLYRDVAKRARSNKTPYFFIVDGLDLIKNTIGEKSILELLPFDPPIGLYLIASASNDFDIPFKHEPFPIPNFSQPETEHYLSDLNIPTPMISEIYNACEGMPGYLSELRSEIESGISIELLLNNLPKGFKSLLDRKWELYKNNSTELSLELISILAFSDIRLDLVMLGQIVDTEPDKLLQILNKIDFVNIISNEESITFVSDAHKKFVAEKLSNRKSRVEFRLIKFLESKPFEKTTVQYLPELYKRANQYDALKKLINSEYIVRTLQTQRDLDILVKNLKLVSEVAFENSDWQSLNKFSIVCSILNTLSTRRIGEGEIDALLSMGDHQTAINRASQAVLPEDKLQLLAKICYGLKKKEIKPPEEILVAIDHLVAQVEPTSISRDRVIDIAADLFHINPNAASELLSRFGAKVDGKLMDVMLTVLSLKLEDEPDSASMLRSMISNSSARDIARVNSPVVGKLSPEEIITEVNLTTDVSVKLYLLRSWCNLNRNNPQAIKVIGFALEIMTNSTEYTPSMRHLRQIAEPLLACEGEEVSAAIDRIDILKNTSIVAPADEKVRIELLLAAIEVGNGSEHGIIRIYETYLELDNITDLDIRCYCRSRFLISYPKINPEDQVFISEIEGKLRNEFDELLKNSADQYNITKKIIRAIASINPYLARILASGLNTVINRDKAYFDIISVYIEHYFDKLEMAIVEETIDRLSEKEKQDWAIVLILRKLADKDSLNCIPEGCRLINDINQFTDPRDQCYAYAYIATLFASTNQTKNLKIILNKLIDSWKLIDRLWIRVEVGFNILSIIGSSAPDFSDDFYSQIIQIKKETPLADEVIAEVYINTVNLLIRSLPDILKGKEFLRYISHLQDSIAVIPALSVQSHLLSKIALHLYLFGKKSEGDSFVKEKVLKILESIHDKEERSLTIVNIAPAFYLFERTIFENEVNQLSLSKKEISINRIINCLLSKRSPDDPIDFNHFKSAPDSTPIFQTMSLIKDLQSDWAIYRAIDIVVDLICSRDQVKNNQESVTLPEKITLSVALEIKTILETKLPDKVNIFHQGYKILCQGSLIRLRAAVLNRYSRAKPEWENVAPTARELVNEINNIPNLADNAFVMTLIGQMFYGEDIKLSHSLLEESKKKIYTLNNSKDRADRFYALADAWKSINDEKSSLVFLREAMTIANMLSWDSSRDEVISQILELAHTIDPEFASSLTSTIDNPVAQDRYNKSLVIKELQNKPHELITVGKSTDEIEEIVGGGAYRLLKSFCSGRGYAQSEKVVCNWLRSCKDSTYKDAFNVYSWSIENNLAMHQKASLPQLVGLFDNLLENLTVIRNIGEILTQVETSRSPYPLFGPSKPSDLELYYVDNNMREAIEKWLSENEGEVIRIYDAYFSYKDLAILKCIKPSKRVDIFTLWKTHKELKIGDRGVEKLYKNKWEELSDQEPPETHIYIIGVMSTGDGPIHDRYILSGTNGISIGTSVGGAGKKDSGIHALSETEVESVENKFIVPLMVGAYRVYKDEKLETLNFTL